MDRISRRNLPKPERYKNISRSYVSGRTIAIVIVGFGLITILNVFWRGTDNDDVEIEKSI